MMMKNEARSVTSEVKRPVMQERGEGSGTDMREER